MLPKISVLMGIFNCASTLPEAIDSLYSQTFKDFILIMCDDGSTDNTYSIAKEYADKYDNIILLRNSKNLKLAATLNRCLEYADTEYVARMDGDDISLPTRFEKEIDFLDKNPEYALVSCPMIFFDETGDWGVGKAYEKPTIYNFRYGSPFAHAPCMIRTTVIKDVSGYTDTTNLIRVEDYYLWFKIYKQGYRGYNIQEPLYKMRDDENSYTRRTFSTRLNAFKVKIKVLRSLGIPFPLFYAIPSLVKGFIPIFLMKILRKKRMGN